MNSETQSTFRCWNPEPAGPRGKLSFQSHCKQAVSPQALLCSPPTSEAWSLVPSTASSGKAGSCLPLVSSLQYRTLTNCMYWFPLAF